MVKNIMRIMNLLINILWKILKDLFGSFDIEGTKEYKRNILKDKGIIINFSSTKIEITKKYIEENNNGTDKNNNDNIDINKKEKKEEKEKSKNNNMNNNINNKKPERYLILISNGK